MVTIDDDGYGIVQFEIDGMLHRKRLRPNTQRFRLPTNELLSNDSSIPSQCTTKSTKSDETFNPRRPSLAFFSQVSVFKCLPIEDLRRLAAACERIDYGEGDIIVRQHDFADAFYVLTQGRVSVIVDGTAVATLEVGAYFGENALLQEDVPRCATVTATTAVSAFAITRNAFRELGLDDKIELPKRQAVGGGVGRVVATKKPVHKTHDERRLMRQAIKFNKNIQAMIALDDTMCDRIIDAAWKEDIREGRRVIKEGDLDADYFYIVQEGRFEVSVENPCALIPGRASTVGLPCINVVQTVQAGGSFGELALLYLAPRAATVTALTEASVWVIDRTTFKRILATANDSIREEHVRWLDASSQFFTNMDQQEIVQFAGALSEMTLRRGERMVDDREELALYMLYDGEVEVCDSNGSVTYLVGSRSKPQLVGLDQLLRDEPWNLSMVVISEEVRFLHMNKATFDHLVGVKSRLIRGDARESKRIHRDDLEELGLLGCGGFGAVTLVQHRVTKATYALKALSKGHVVKCGMQSSVRNEKEIQLMCDSPFVVKLYETYNGDQSLFFLLELALGGELYRTYRRNGLYGSSEHARFYLAGVVFAFEHLHDKMVIHRDLKPENLLLTVEGRIKLADMGLAKVTVGKTYTTCGTPVYFAPEMIDSSSGHTKAVDWWTFGVLAFELMSGRTPFERDTPAKTYAAVRKGIDQVTFPTKLSGSCEDFVRAVCRFEATERLPMRKGGTENIRKHIWYRGFNWRAMLGMTLKPPYTPAVESTTDFTNFCTKQDRRPPQIPYTNDGSGWDEDFATCI
jgi:cGMP-dependent protein kinase